MVDKQVVSRTNWIDFAKGLGIILVIIGHTRLNELIVPIYFFHIPMFFFLSGYVFSGIKYDFKVYLKKQATRLLIPFYSLGIIMLFGDTMLNLYYINFDTSRIWTDTPELTNIYQFVFQERFGTLWYIICLFYMSLIMYGILKLVKERYWLGGFICVIMATLAMIYYAFGGKSLPLNLDASFAMMIFYYLGYIVKVKNTVNNSFVQSHSVLLFLGFGGLCVLFGVLNFICMGSQVNIYDNSYGIAPFMYLASILGTFAIICIAQKINSKALCYIGRNSMIIYGLHQCAVFPIVRGITYPLNICTESDLLSRFGECVILLVFSFLLLIPVTIGLQHTRFGKYFGV